MLFEATKFVEICYAAVENQYYVCLWRCGRTRTPRHCGQECRSTAAQEHSLAISSKAEHPPAVRQLIYAWYLPKRNQNTYPTRLVHKCAQQIYLS